MMHTSLWPVQAALLLLFGLNVAHGGDSTISVSGNVVASGCNIDIGVVNQ